MLSKFPEKTIHKIRWLLAIGWLLLILSLFYDPVSAILTHPDNSSSPFSLASEVLTYQECVQVQQKCLIEQPYPIGARIWWTIIVPYSIPIIFVLGHEFWRRICPLSFISQLPLALGWQRKRKVVNPRTGKIYDKVVVIGENSWLGKNYLYVQFSFLFLGLVARILFINSHRTCLGIFLVLTIVAAIIVGYLYSGKSWCNYFCPMAPVQTVLTGPRGLLGSKAHEEPKSKITQSVCRTVDSRGREKNTCTGCKSFCIDIDAERTYWEELKQPGRRLVHYGYLGIVLGFYFYHFIYAGNWHYYYSGAWSHEENQLETIFAPGFYLFNQSIPIPKFIAVCLTFGFFINICYLLGVGLEKSYIAYRKRQNNPVSRERAQHIIFTIFSVTSFWSFFFFGIHPSLNLLPIGNVRLFDAFVILSGSIWLYRTLNRTRKQYNRERLAGTLRRQLEKLHLNFSEFLQGRSLQELNSDEIYILAKVLPGATHHERKRVYISIVREILLEDKANLNKNMKILKTLRQELGLHEEEHYEIMYSLLNT